MNTLAIAVNKFEQQYQIFFGKRMQLGINEKHK